jgi:hypothetical protein
MSQVWRGNVIKGSWGNEADRTFFAKLKGGTDCDHEVAAVLGAGQEINSADSA